MSVQCVEPGMMAWRPIRSQYWVISRPMRGEYWYLLDHGAPPTAAPPPSTHHDGDAGVEEHALPVPQVRGAVHQRSANNNIQFQHNTNSTFNCQSYSCERVFSRRPACDSRMLELALSCSVKGQSVCPINKDCLDCNKASQTLEQKLCSEPCYNFGDS